MRRVAWLVAVSAVAVAGCSGDDPPQAASGDRPDEVVAADAAPAAPPTPPPPTQPAPTSAGLDDAEPVVAPDDGSSEPTAPRTVVEGGVELPAGDDAEVLGPLGATEVEIDTGEGTVQIGRADLPASVPAEFPVPDDLRIQLATDVGDQAGFSGVTALDFDAVLGLYREGFAALGYDVSDVRLIDGSLAVLAFSAADGRGEVAISRAPGGGHSVLVTFTS